MNKKEIIIKTIKKAGFPRGARVLLRADFNVPISEGNIKNDFKIRASLPTIDFLRSKGAKIIIISHLGRPDGKENKKYSLQPVAKYLSDIADYKVNFAQNCLGQEALDKAGKLAEGDILLLENLRFHKEEEGNKSRFAASLASLADFYVNDAFGASHRAHASVDKIKRYLPSYAGLLLEKEVLSLNRVLQKKSALVLIVGGAKLESKIPLLKKLGSRASKILIGGAIANNFLLARGFEVGKSVINQKTLRFAKKFKSKKIILPIDAVVSNQNKKQPIIKVKKINKIDKKDMIVDIGPDTVTLFARFISRAEIIVWNGPLGVFENDDFKSGTMAIAGFVASRSSGRAFGLVGGGETVEAVQKIRASEEIDWISTGGGAMLAMLAGEKMPGLKGLVKY